MSLRQQLDHSARYDAEYSGNLSSHLPMALTALARLGADDARLAAFAERYVEAMIRPENAEAQRAGGLQSAGQAGQAT